MKPVKCSEKQWTFGAALLGIALGAASGLVLAESARTYTLNADFDLPNAVKFNVDHAPVTTLNNGLELTTVGTTFPVLWIANAGEDTVSKIDTSSGTEVARYRTWFAPGSPGNPAHANNPFAGPAPSRSAVDKDGNAYVLNRHFDGRRAQVTKILNTGGIDRNGNGTIETSTGPADLKPLVDNNAANAQIDTAEIQDERIAWVSYVGAANGLGRALCIGTDGHLWVGLFNAQQYWKISSVDGSVLAGPVATPGFTAYGCLIDSSNNLWSANLSNALGKITNTNLIAGHVFSTIPHGGSCGQNYGIALGNGRVYLACISGGGYIECNPGTNTCFRPATAPAPAATGISVDGNGDIWLSQYQNGGVFKQSPAHAALCSNAAGAGFEHRGVIIDQNNDAWQIGVSGDVIKRFLGSTCAAQNSIPVGDAPYTYSDASGLAALTQTSRTGTWTVTQDAGADNAYWGNIAWDATLPAGSSVEVKMQVSNNLGALAGPPSTVVTNGANFAAFGRFIKVEARLNATPANVSPQLLNISVNTRTCDVDLDGDIDRADIALIAAAAKTNMSVPPADTRDPDRDGIVTVKDARTCTLRCTRPQCAL